MPGFIMGRNKDLNWGFTYGNLNKKRGFFEGFFKGFVDQLDFFVEHCKNRTCRQGDKFVPVTKRVEKILRKGRKRDILVCI